MAETNNNPQEPTKNTGAGIPKTKLDYHDAMLLLEVEGLARDGYDDEQIADILMVNPSTFSRNKTKKQERTTTNPRGESDLSQALKRGRRPLSVIVENSLYKRANGLKVTSTTTVTKRIILEGTEMEATEILTTETITELPPDTGAAAFWLKNHKPDQYNTQPFRVDATTNGKDINELPRIGKIEHVVIQASEVEKLDAET